MISTENPLLSQPQTLASAATAWPHAIHFERRVECVWYSDEPFGRAHKCNRVLNAIEYCDTKNRLANHKSSFCFVAKGGRLIDSDVSTCTSALEISESANPTVRSQRIARMVATYHAASLWASSLRSKRAVPPIAICTGPKLPNIQQLAAWSSMP